jgi:hypothetical protein
MKYNRWPILRRIFKYSSPFISLFEKKFINKYGRLTPRYNPVFILGAPRTGSTILYQMITNYLDVLYIDNLINLTRNNLYFGFWLSNKIFKNKPHNSYKSEYGNTTSEGLHAPSEAGPFWYRWISPNKIYLESGEIPDKKINEIRNNIFSVINRYNKILIIKNNFTSQRLKLIKEIAPEAKFIFIKRNPLFAAQSIILTRQKVYGERNRWWSIKPKNYEELKDLTFIEQVVKQIYYIEKQIVTDIKLFRQQNLLTVNYDEILNRDLLLKKIQNFIGATPIRKSFLKTKIYFSEEQKIENGIFEDLKKEVSKYDWINYKY